MTPLRSPKHTLAAISSTHTHTLVMGAQETQLESRAIPRFQLKLERQKPFDINN